MIWFLLPICFLAGYICRNGILMDENRRLLDQNKRLVGHYSRSVSENAGLILDLAATRLHLSPLAPKQTFTVPEIHSIRQRVNETN
jgi:hypothetical protein